MEKGREVAFLSKRQGFVKLAIQQGVDIIPCFAFGQTASYDWWKPGPPIVPLKLVHWVRRPRSESQSGKVGSSTWHGWGLEMHNHRLLLISIPDVCTSETPVLQKLSACIGPMIKSI